VADNILSVAKTFTALGAPDPRLNAIGKIDPRLANMYTAMGKQDPPPNRVKPVPLQLQHHLQAQVEANPTDAKRATIDMSWIGVFYLLRPGEYCKANDNTPVQMKDIGLLIGNRKLDPCICAFADLDRATSSSIHFDTHKNRTRGEIIAHARSGHPIACPTKTVVRRIKYLRTNGAGPKTPLCAFRKGNRWIHVTSNMVTNELRCAASDNPQLGIDPSKITARSLRAGGAMALLCGKVDTDTIRLVGRWHSDAMFRYLHGQALPIIKNLAQTMLLHGCFTLTPGAYNPPQGQAIINAVPSPDKEDEASE
jgi:hypothetical protein